MRKKYKLKKKVKKFLKLSVVLILFFLFLTKFFKKDDKTIEEEVEVVSKYTEEELASMTTLQRLEVMMETDKKIEKIINNYNFYPEDLLKAMIKNVEMKDFVLNYIEKKGTISSDDVGKIKKNTIPLLMQWDQRWGYAEYGDDIIALSGCGPTALSMVITGLTGDNSITPYVVSKFATENNYYDKGNGTAWTLMSEGSKYFGLNAKEIPLNKSIIFSYLEDHKPIIAIMGKGDFTDTGHYIVFTGVKNGKIKINDSNSISRSNKLWNYEKIESQIRNMWVFSLD